MASETYHEPYDLISPGARDMHRGIWSLIEELEAIDWYQQRADVTGDEELRAVLIHNKNEEIEHAMMTLEWLRRNSPEFDANLRTYVFGSGPITEVEEKVEAAANGGSPAGLAGAGRGEGGGREGGKNGGGRQYPAPRPVMGSLGIGSLKRG